MMKRIAFNFAASSVVLGVTTVGCMMNGVGTGAAVAQSQTRSDQQAARLFEQANRAITAGNIDEARTTLERAVVLAPRDAGYRMLLADAYMKSGRFQSAEATYRDVLLLDPGRTRAALSLALMQVANGRQQDAMAQLERIEGQASPADLGLAFALAGSPQRAIEILEPAARAMGATARVRQNLALAYAFGGDWQRARTIAAQDVSPAELSNRMTNWASLAQRSGSPDQVAAMLGVSPAHDVGQPAQLALSRPVQAPAAVQAPALAFAAAEPVEVATPMPGTARPAAQAPAPIVFAVAQPAVPAPAPVAAPAQAAAPAAQPAPARSAPAPVAYAAAQPYVTVAPAPAPTPVPVPAAAPAQAPITLPPPVAYAEAEPVGDPVPVPIPATAPAPAEETAAVAYAELEQPEWGLDEAGGVQLPQQEPAAERMPAREQYAAAAETLVRPDPVVMPVASRAVRSLAPVAARVIRAASLGSRRSATGRFVVQIGAFSSAANAERAWQLAERRYGLRAEQPVTMTIDMNGRLLHRVAISGFDKRGDAAQTCQSIRSRGGECFVRNSAGDAANSWAARYTGRG